MYNGEDLNSSMPQHMKAYVSQFDLHHPEMTVRETLNFSCHLLETNNAFGKFPFFVSLFTFEALMPLVPFFSSGNHYIIY